MSTKSTATPGPWEVRSHTDSFLRPGYTTAEIGQASGPRVLVAEVWQSTPGRSNPELEANLTLLAAAPELRDALLRYVTFDECGGGCTGPGDWCAYCQARAALDRSRLDHSRRG